MNKDKYSIKNISKLFNEEDIILLYGQFLDCFYSSKTDEEKISLIIDEPIYNEKNNVFMCILAGTAEKLANDYNLPIPEWVNKTKYTLNYIYYAFNTNNEKFKEYLDKTTPNEYKKRNVIVGETILERC